MSDGICEQFRRLKLMVGNSVCAHRSVQSEVTAINLKRLVYAALIGMPLSLAQFVVFASRLSSQNAVENRWSLGIMVCHAVLFSILGFSGLASFILRKRETTAAWMRVVPGVSIIAFLIVGSALSSIDQLVASNINAYLIACTATGAIFVKRPLSSLLTYLGNFILFCLAMPLVQKDAAILLSNRVNALTITGLAIFLSYMLYKSNVAGILQQRYIKEQQRELEKLAFYDQITGLYNRSMFEVLIKKEISLLRRNAQEASIILADIDNFKQINDGYGHHVGDFVIKHVAAMLVTQTRKADSVARWGGDEFIIFLPHTKLENAVLVAEKLRNAVSRHPFETQDGSINIFASFGVACLRPDADDALLTAFRSADKALYKAKLSGRNRVEVSEEPLPVSES
jgi:diguanylate cyclase (GGDEF)-like protein